MLKLDEKILAEKILKKYKEKEFTRIDELKAADKKVSFGAKVFSYIFGSFGTLVMGGGMSLVMTDIGEKIGISDFMTAGILIGILGMAVVIGNYPLFKKIIKARRKKYSAEIINLGNKIAEK